MGFVGWGGRRRGAPGYRVSVDTKEYKALYRQDGAIHSFIFEMRIEATIVECMCLAWEFDLVKSWNKVS